MWFFLSLYFALWTSVAVFVSKRILRGVSPPLMAAAGIFSVPFMFAIVLVTTGIPKVDSLFWLGVFMSAFLNVFAGIASFTAIKYAPISLIMPMSSFNPVFTTLFAIFLLGEVPSFLKATGILVIVIGSYLLHVSDIRKSLWQPFIELFANKYVLLFLLSNFLWAITPIFEKTAIWHTSPSSPILVAATAAFLLGLFLTPVILKTVVNPLSEIKNNIHWFLLLAPFIALGAWVAFTAFSLANLGYVTAIFKLSVLFTILWGWFFFREERIKERLLGGGVMLLGTILLVI